MPTEPQPLPSILETIVAHKRREVMARQDRGAPPSLAGAPPPRDFAAALRAGARPAGVRLIAEVKKASPSRGVLRAVFDPLELALTYAASGAAAISVLTDETFFHGHDEYLRAIRARVAVPVLRKEFIIDPWQVAESRALGADAILLIVALLDDVRLRDFIERAADLGMAALVEVHTGPELERALAAGAPVIGVNNRDLHTFETTLATTERLGPVVKQAGRVLVSESGLHGPADVARVAAAGADAILVGEALVCADDVGAKVRELGGAPRDG
jgi:indole-3-glycerol phosphate synthase